MLACRPKFLSLFRLFSTTPSINPDTLARYVNSTLAPYISFINPSVHPPPLPPAQDLGKLKSVHSSWDEYSTVLQSIAETRQACLELNSDKAILEIALAEIDELSTRLEDAKQALYHSILTLADKDDSHSNAGYEGVQLRLQIGFGNDDASELLSHLFSMYKKRAMLSKWPLDVVYTELYRSNPEWGFKSATINIHHSSAWKYLKHENGLHRFSRASPRDSGRLQTSSVQVVALPLPLSDEFEEKTAQSTTPKDWMTNFNSTDFKIDKYNASGPGGQNVNKTATAVRITHIPSGCVVQMQDSRSQHQNMKDAKQIIQQRIQEHHNSANRETRKLTLRSLQKEDRQDRWSQKIRSYIYHSSRVVDNRLTDEKGKLREWDCNDVLNGPGLVQIGEELYKSDLELKVTLAIQDNLQVSSENSKRSD